MLKIAVSMGDPAGIGREIAINAWRELRNNPHFNFVIVGDFKAMQDAANYLGGDCPICQIQNIDDEFDFSQSLGVYQPQPLANPAQFGKADSANAAAIIEYINIATQAVIAGKFDAITTLPIAKAPLYAAGFKHAGHTEFVAEICKDMPFNGTRGPIMMLAIEGLRIALATIHLPLNQVPHALDVARIKSVIMASNEALINDFGIAKPKIAILGLNPHAGEDGTIGMEEVDIINPICQNLRELNIDCTDALPADSAFAPFNREKYDAYVAMYHDQGLIPIKALDFWGGVNITLGLPIIRTSPDHGTGFEIAGKNIANPQSFINALKCAADMANNRKNRAI